MLQKQVNCWEYKQCGRQPGGKNIHELGVCPAATDASFDGINCGVNAGRICWAVAGTCCGGKIQGTFAEKRVSCINCDFYNLVQEQEGTSKSAKKLLKFLADNETSPFLAMMGCRQANAGERLVVQGEVRDHAYLIQRGSSLVIVEKDGELHPVGHRGRGDIIGVTSILTGEPQNAHIEAETDMELWVLDRNLFSKISEDDPGLLDFLTEIVAERFDSKRPIADRTIGKYVAKDIIGRGGYSIVYKGLHTGLGMPVAIKMLRHDLALNSYFHNTFLNEARTIATLNHENIVKVYDIEEQFRTIFIVEQFIEGESLKQLLKRLGRISVPTVVGYLFQILSGLDYAHKRGIIHRDVNPSNIVVQRDDSLKILDFGLSCPAGTEDSDFAGTAAYLSPEQIQGGVVDERTDIYALGITTYEMLTGKKPFYDKDLGALMQMHLNRDIPEPCRIMPNLPDALNQFVVKAASRNPEERYGSATKAMEAIVPLAEAYGTLKRQVIIEKPKIASLFVFYNGRHQAALNQMIEDFGNKAKELGITLQRGESGEA